MGRQVGERHGTEITEWHKDDTKMNIFQQYHSTFIQIGEEYGTRASRRAEVLHRVEGPL